MEGLSAAGPCSWAQGARSGAQQGDQEPGFGLVWNLQGAARYPAAPPVETALGREAQGGGAWRPGEKREQNCPCQGAVGKMARVQHLAGKKVALPAALG